MLSWEQVHAAVRPLRWIFWGGILCIFDVTFSSTTNGEGFRFDLLDDTLGAVLITWGVVRLARAPVPGRYGAVMRFVVGVAAATIVETAIKHWVFPHPDWLSFLLTVLGLCQTAAIILFCLAMRWFCEEAGLPRVAASWRVTFLLYVVLYGVPMGLLQLAGLVATMTGGSFHWDLGAGAVLLVAGVLVPLVHLFVSTSRMRRAAEGLRMDHVPPPGGFPVVFPGEGQAPNR
jgi:hypothetical protein